MLGGSWDSGAADLRSDSRSSSAPSRRSRYRGFRVARAIDGAAPDQPSGSVTVTIDGKSAEVYDASYALVIGIDGYNNGWRRLSEAVNDAVEVAKELKRHRFEVKLLADRDVEFNGQKIRGQLITQEVLAGEISKFVYHQGADPNARLMIWFSGHRRTLAGNGFIVPQDAPLPDASNADFESKSLPLERFGEYMRLVRARHVLAIFNSCFSGKIFRVRGAETGGSEVNQTALEKVRQFISSGDADQKVADDGTFRKLFINALQGRGGIRGLTADENNDGLLTGTELGQFLAQNVPVNSYTGRQTPQYSKFPDQELDKGEFIFEVLKPTH